MKNLLTPLVLIFGLLFLIGCNDNTVSSNESDLLTQEFDSSAEMRAPAPGDKTIAGIVSQDAEFTLLLEALVYAELAATFAGDDQYTVFAPTNAAFETLVKSLPLDEKIVEEDGPFAAIDKLLGEGAVKDVLLYHVAEGRRAANSVVPKNERAKDRKIETLLEDASFSVAFGGTITDVDGQKVKITDPNITASNGIIHEIDTVLLPLELESVLE